MMEKRLFYTGEVPSLSDWEFSFGVANHLVADAMQEALNNSLGEMVCLDFEGASLVVTMWFGRVGFGEHPPTWKIRITDAVDELDMEDGVVNAETVLALRQLADRIEAYLAESPKVTPTP